MSQCVAIYGEQSRFNYSNLHSILEQKFVLVNANPFEFSNMMLDVKRPISKFMEMIGGQTLPSDLRNFSG